MLIIWGFMVTMGTMKPDIMGPFGSMKSCNIELSARVAQMQSVDTANTWKGACMTFDKRGKDLKPPANTAWLDAPALKALSDTMTHPDVTK